MTYIYLLAIISFILVFYFAALLIFTPYEEDDKYVLKILESGYKLHLAAINKGGFFKKIIDYGAKAILTIVYFILKDRKYTEIVEVDEDENSNAN